MIPQISYFLIILLVLVACLQDFKRREIDHWVNLLIFLTGSFSLVITSVLSKNFIILISFVIALLVNFLLSQLFYKSRIFGGGDSDLLLALTPIITTALLKTTLLNLALFVLLVLLAGAIYGLIYIIIAYFKNINFVNRELKKKLQSRKIFFYIAPILILFVLSIIEKSFLLLLILLIIYPLLFLVSRILDKRIMKRTIKGNKLFEGDILTKKISYKKRTFNEGRVLSKEDLNLLKGASKIEIKDGIPFALSFLLALIIYFFLEIGLVIIPFM